MAKKFVKITLAAKCRILFGAAAIMIIGLALVVPWLYMESMASDRALLAGREVTRMFANEWADQHDQPDAFVDEVSGWFIKNDSSDVREGPKFYPVREAGELGPAAPRSARRALKAFGDETAEDVLQIADTNDKDRRIYRTFRAIRYGDSCLTPDCHGPSRPLAEQRKVNELGGVVVMDMPRTAGTNMMLTRLVIIAAGVLGFALAVLTFHFIAQKLILSPVRRLKTVADKVAEGDLTVRSDITTGDEYEQLGRSFDEMLLAITETQEQLRAANRALDLKLNELAEANVALYESNRLKSEFLANVSHELRTPLNSIIGFAELLGDNEDSLVKRYAENILNPARMLLRIINDLLDLARIEAGKVRLIVTRASVSDICETLVSLVTPLARKKDLTLTLVTDDAIPIITTDAGKVQQILYNLLSNAIKFTPAAGSVAVTARTHLDKRHVSVCVADTGPGIGEADHGQIFEKFHQLDATVTRQHGGAGLGLPIAKDLAQLLGGRLDLHSEPGKGAAFTLTLPLAMPDGE